MTCDFLAFCSDTSAADLERLPWDQQLALMIALASTHDQLTKQVRPGFVERVAVNNREHQTLTAAGLGQMQRAGLAPATGSAEAMHDWPAGSARLRLRFRLLSPLLSIEQDTFGLFDNALRKDRLFLCPHLSAATIKGLAADAYQRAFPPATPWDQSGASDPERTRALRAADPSAGRLFGLANADDTDVAQGPPGFVAGQGRLQFSPVWFERVQFLVMNPQDPRTASGTVPIQFEAVAPDQEAQVDLIYFNPAGFDQSDEGTVRADLARLLWALAQWWPALGLGAKRLAGYGAIAPLKARLEAVGWPSLGSETVHDEQRQGPGSWAALAHWIDGDA
jgi:hypothetical protein